MQNQPTSLRAAAKALANGTFKPDDPSANHLLELIERWKGTENEKAVAMVMTHRPKALSEAVEILIKKPAEIREVMLHYPYTDPAEISGFLDDFLPAWSPEQGKE